MKKLNFYSLLKLLVVFLLAGMMVTSGKIIYDHLSRATRVNPELVASYRPHLDISLVKSAAGVLQEKNKNLEEITAKEKEEKRVVEEKEEKEEAEATESAEIH